MPEDYNIDATALKDQFGLRGMNSADRDYFARARSAALDPLMERNMKLRDQYMQEQAHDLMLATNMFNLKNAVDAKKKEREYDKRADELTNPLATIRFGGHKPKEALAKLDELELEYSDIFRNSPKARDMMATYRKLFSNRMERNKEEATKNKERRNKITSKYLTSAETIFSQEQADKLIGLYKRERGITEENPADLDDELVIQQINNLWMGKAKAAADKAAKDAQSNFLKQNEARLSANTGRLAKVGDDDDDMDKAISDFEAARAIVSDRTLQGTPEMTRADELSKRIQKYFDSVGASYGLEQTGVNPYDVKAAIKARSDALNKEREGIYERGAQIWEQGSSPQGAAGSPQGAGSSTEGVGSGFKGLIPTK